MDAVTGLFQPIGEQERRPMRQRFQVEYTDCDQRLIYLRLYSGTLRLRIRWPRRERKAENHRDAYSIQRGNCSTDTAYPGEIVILPSDSVRLNDVLGDPTRLLVKGGARTPPHAADVDCAENGSAKRTAAGRSYATCGY